ncbi:MAG TPA: peptidase S13, partial [Thermodesulfobacteriota bacterium]|nr:peptidase S13 [Thermodesulfobacteriota bacterium]
MRYRKSLLAFFLVLTAVFGLYGGCSSGGGSDVPANIRAIFDKPLYSDSVWGLRVVDLETGEVLID